MYNITKNGAPFAMLDNLIPVKLNRNNTWIPCDLAEAEGIVMGNDYVEPIDGLEIRWMNGANKIGRMNTAGAEAMQSLNAEPPVSAGVFTYGEWQPDMAYEQYALFTYQGNAGFVRQAHTSLAVYPPFSVGTESLYGARPSPDSEGVYPYVYNMKVEVGMKVRSEKDGNVYTAIQPADPLLYDPADVPAHFTK